MQSLEAALLVILQSLPGYYEDDRAEPWIDRTERFSDISTAIVSVSAGNVHRMALLAMKAWFETRLSWRIHADRCRPDECDRGLAKSLFQLQQTGNLTKAQWDAFGGLSLEATIRAARHANLVLNRSFKLCKSVTGAISMYATGRHCSWGFARRRTHMYEQILHNLRDQLRTGQPWYMYEYRLFRRHRDSPRVYDPNA